MYLEWRYLFFALCISMTSSAVLHYQGNEMNRHGDEPSDVREEIQAPPIEIALMKNPHGKSNEALCRELCRTGDGGNACLCDWTPLKKEVMFSLRNFIASEPRHEFIKFPTPTDTPACKLLCENGVRGHFCLC